MTLSKPPMHKTGNIYQICKDEFLDMHELVKATRLFHMHLVCHDIIALTDSIHNQGIKLYHGWVLTCTLFPEHEELS